MTTKIIKIKEETHHRLDMLRADEKLGTFDNTIKWLLDFEEQNQQ